MSRMKLFALEEEVVVNEVTNGVEGELTAMTNEVDQNVSEVVQSSENMSDGLDASDELTEVKDVMDQSIEAGTGLDPVAAEMARISIRNILSKIGAEHYTSQMMVASESFGSTSSRLANTRYASENVGEFIGKIWAKVKNGLESMYAQITRFGTNFLEKIGHIRRIMVKTKKIVETSELNSETTKVSGYKIVAADVNEFKEYIKNNALAQSEAYDFVNNIEKEILPLFNSAKALASKSFDGMNAKKSVSIPSNKKDIYSLGPITATANSGKISSSIAVTELNIGRKSTYANEVTLTNKKKDLVDLLDLVNSELIEGKYNLSEMTNSMTVVFSNKLLKDQQSLSHNVAQYIASFVDFEKSEKSKEMNERVRLVYDTLLVMSHLNPAILNSSFKLTTDVIKYVNLCVKENGKKAG